MQTLLEKVENNSWKGERVEVSILKAERELARWHREERKIPGRGRGSHECGRGPSRRLLGGGGQMVESLDGKPGFNLHLRHDRGHSQV